jgi:tyrosyl-DNA phosphodiesterase 1
MGFFFFLRAIAASLAHSQREVIVIDSDGEQDDNDAQFQRDLQAALKASQASRISISPTPSLRDPQSDVAAAETPPGSVTSAPTFMSNFLAERKNLEAERLARQKRLRDDIKDHEESVTEDEDEEIKPPLAKRQATHTSRAAAASRTNHTGSSSTSTLSNSFFWDGALRPTANMHWDIAHRDRPVFRLTDIIGDVR